MTTTTATTTLPFTGVGVPATPAFVLTKVRAHNTYDGQALYADVKVDGVVIGGIENQGTGGGTWFRPMAPGAHALWVEAVAAYKAANPDHPYPEFAEENLADDLWTEAHLVKKVTAAMKRSKVILRDPLTDRQAWEDDGYPYYETTALGGRVRPGYERWDGTTWVTT